MKKTQLRTVPPNVTMGTVRSILDLRDIVLKSRKNQKEKLAPKNGRDHRQRMYCRLPFPIQTNLQVA